MAKWILKFGLKPLLPGGHPPHQLPSENEFSQLSFKQLENRSFKWKSWQHLNESPGNALLSFITSAYIPNASFMFCALHKWERKVLPWIIVQLIIWPWGIHLLIKNAKRVNWNNRWSLNHVFWRVSRIAINHSVSIRLAHVGTPGLDFTTI